MRPLALAIGVVDRARAGLSRSFTVVFARIRSRTPGPRRVRGWSRRRSIPTRSRPASRDYGVVGYRVPLPAGLTDGDSVELRFRDALDGAKVEAVAEGPRLHATLLHKRVGGDTVAVPLAPGRVDAVELRVRHHFRAPPILRAAVVFAPATASAADPPPAASPRSTR